MSLNQDDDREFRNAATAYALARARFNDDPSDNTGRRQLHAAHEALVALWSVPHRRGLVLVFRDWAFVLSFTHCWEIFRRPVVMFPDGADDVADSELDALVGELRSSVRKARLEFAALSEQACNAIGLDPDRYELDFADTYHGDTLTADDELIREFTLPAEASVDGGDLFGDDAPTPARRAAEQLAEAVEGAVARLDYLRELWGDEGVTRTVADKLRAALAAARDTTNQPSKES